MNSDEYSLVCALTQGSNEAFHQLYHLYKARLFAFILQMVSSHDHAEEIFQHTFVKLWEHRANIEPDKSFSAYLYTIARNNVYSFWRQCLHRKKLEQSLAINSQYPTGPNLENEMADKDYLSYLYAILDHLPPRRKEIFVLKYLYNKSYKEISQRLHISEKTVDNQLQKAIIFVRAHIESEDL